MVEMRSAMACDRFDCGSAADWFICVMTCWNKVNTCICCCESWIDSASPALLDVSAAAAAAAAAGALLAPNLLKVGKLNS